MDLLHRKAQSYKFSNKNVIFCTWRDFNKTFCGISTYHKRMFKLQVSSIFNFDRAQLSWISGLLGVKHVIIALNFDNAWLFQKTNLGCPNFKCQTLPCLVTSVRVNFVVNTFCYRPKFRGNSLNRLILYQHFWSFRLSIANIIARKNCWL